MSNHGSRITMLAKRIIPCLDIDRGRVVKGIKFEDVQDAGDPVEVARKYDAQGADELVFLDITASVDDRPTLFQTVEAVARQVYIPRSEKRRVGKEVVRTFRTGWLADNQKKK